MSNIIKLFAGLFTGSFLVASCGMIYYNRSLAESKNLKTITSEQPKEVSERSKHEQQEIENKRNEVRKQEELKRQERENLNFNSVENVIKYCNDPNDHTQLRNCFIGYIVKKTINPIREYINKNKNKTTSIPLISKNVQKEIGKN